MGRDLDRRRLLLAVGGAGAVVVAAATGLVRTGTLGPPTRGRGAWTTFGSVAVLGSTWWRDVGGDADHDHDDHDHTDVHAVSPTAHGSWQDTVIVEVEVHNGGRRPILVSPGQFRLRVDRGASVTHYASAHGPTRLEGGHDLASRLSFLVPPGVGLLDVEFADPEGEQPLSFPLRPSLRLGAG